MDPTLGDLVKRAEAGDRVPRIQIVTGSTLVSGRPISHAEFQKLQRVAISNERFEERRPKIKERVAVKQEADDQAAQDVATLSSPPEGAALALKAVTVVLLSTGETITTETVRVPVDQVNTWWTGAFIVQKPKAGWWVGGLIPIPLGN